MLLRLFYMSPYLAAARKNIIRATPAPLLTRKKSRTDIQANNLTEPKMKSLALSADKNKEKAVQTAQGRLRIL
jgi:hypothetical protein